MPGVRLFTSWSMHFEPKVDFYEAFSCGFNPDILYQNTLYALHKYMESKADQKLLSSARPGKKRSSYYMSRARHSNTAGSDKLSAIEEQTIESFDTSYGKTSAFSDAVGTNTGRHGTPTLSSMPTSLAGSSLDPTSSRPVSIAGSSLEINGASPLPGPSVAESPLESTADAAQLSSSNDRKRQNRVCEVKSR